MGLWGPQHLAVAIMISSCLWPGGFFSCCHASMGRWNPRLSRPYDHCSWALVVVVIVTAIHQIVTQTPYRYTTEISPNPQKMFCNGLEDEFARTNVILGVPFECVWQWSSENVKTIVSSKRRRLTLHPNRKSGSESDEWYTPSNAMMVGWWDDWWLSLLHYNVV